MRTTILFHDALIDRVQGLTGLTEKSALVREALKALIVRESARKCVATSPAGRHRTGAEAGATPVD